MCLSFNGNLNFYSSPCKSLHTLIEVIFYLPPLYSVRRIILDLTATKHIMIANKIIRVFVVTLF